MCNKDVNTYPYAIRFASECYKRQEICDKAVNTSSVTFFSASDRNKNQEICNRLVSEDLFKLLMIVWQY